MDRRARGGSDESTASWAAIFSYRMRVRPEMATRLVNDREARHKWRSEGTISITEAVDHGATIDRMCRNGKRCRVASCG